MCEFHRLNGTRAQLCLPARHAFGERRRTGRKGEGEGRSRKGERERERWRERGEIERYRGCEGPAATVRLHSKRLFFSSSRPFLSSSSSKTHASLSTLRRRVGSVLFYRFSFLFFFLSPQKTNSSTTRTTFFVGFIFPFSISVFFLNFVDLCLLSKDRAHLFVPSIFSQTLHYIHNIVLSVSRTTKRDLEYDLSLQNTLGVDSSFFIFI